MNTKKESQDVKAKKELGSLLPEIVDEIPSDIQEKLKELGIRDEKSEKLIAVMLQVSRSYKGPLPTAEQFALYGKACPGAGKRILKYMENEQESRHAIDSKAVTAAINDTKRGQWLGFIVMVSLIGLAALAIFSGSVVLGGIIAFLTAGAGVCHKLIDGKSHSEKTKKN